MTIRRGATGWSIRVMVGGQAFRDFVKGHENYAEAEAIELDAIAAMKRGLSPKHGKVKDNKTVLTLQYAFDENWSQNWQNQSIGYQKKIIQYWTAIKSYFIEEMGIRTLEQIDTKAIDGYIKTLRDSGNKAKTVNNKILCLSSMLRLMFERGHLKAVPIIHWVKVKNNSRPRYFSAIEEQEILKMADDFPFHTPNTNELIKDFIITLADTGMRPWSEAKALNLNWIVRNNRGERIIRIPRDVTKTDTERELPITPRLEKILHRHTSHGVTEGLVFRDLDYKWHCQRFWNELVRPTKGWGELEVWYCFRHTFATRLCEYDVNLKVVQSLLGHSCITQTARYAKTTDVAKQNAMNALHEGRQNALNAMVL
jgi:integrase